VRKVNEREVEWTLGRQSPSRKFERSGKKLSEALGRDPKSLDLNKRHPFDVEIQRVPPGSASCPYHAHSAQWEFYHVISGQGTVRHCDGKERIKEGDAFLFKPTEAHQIINDGVQDLILCVVADNPLGEVWYYPDSNKWTVNVPEYRIMRSEPLDYYDGEE